MPRRKLSGRNKLFASLLFLLLSCVFQYAVKISFGWSPDFVLGGLITFSFFLGFIEMLFLGVISVFFLNWQPYFSSEMLMLVALPLLVIEVKTYFPWRIEVAHLLSIFFGLVVFYGISSYHSLLSNPTLFLKSAGWTFLFSVFVFQLFNYFYNAKET